MHTACNTPPLLPAALLFCLILPAACDSLVQDVDLAPANLPPTLAVSAAITTDKGELQITFTEARSISSYKTWRSENANIVRNGTVALYEDDNPQPIYSIENGGDGNGFDMSLRPAESGFAIRQKGLTFKAGSAYKLVLDIEGYPITTATAVMPDPPSVGVEPLNTGEIVRRKYPYTVGGGIGAAVGEEREFYPIRLHLADNSRGRDYYMFGLQSVTRYPGQASDSTFPVDLPVGISSWALIQDNPDLEAEAIPIETLFDVYIFSRMLMSDMSFANATGTVDLLMLKDFAWMPPDLSPPCDGDAEKVFTFIEICISHLSTMTYDHHRSLVLQREEVSFFTEPVSIASNIENGYGCFAAFNTVRDTIWSACYCEQPYIKTKN